MKHTLFFVSYKYSFFILLAKVLLASIIKIFYLSTGVHDNEKTTLYTFLGFIFAHLQW